MISVSGTENSHFLEYALMYYFTHSHSNKPRTGLVGYSCIQKVQHNIQNVGELSYIKFMDTHYVGIYDYDIMHYKVL